MNSQHFQTKLASWFAAQCEASLIEGSRIATLLSGSKDWGQDVATSLVNLHGAQRVLVVSADIPGSLAPAKARTQLGNEYDVILFDAHPGFDPEAFGAISGTLCAGGLFILLLPELPSWSEYRYNRFLQRAIRLSKKHQAVFFIEQDQPLPAIVNIESIGSVKQACPAPFRTAEQQQVVLAIEENANQQQPAPLVITSDRGRGKSSALGLAAGGLLGKGFPRIIVTAPRLATTEPVFRHAQQVLPDAESARSRLTYRHSQLEFFAPDNLLEQQPQADLLMVDEAAAIPLPMLEQLLHCYPHIVLATTTHGYEGTGRGFALKFNKILDAFNANWQSLKMRTPIRWKENDPVEHWVDRLLCLDAELDEVDATSVAQPGACQVYKIDREQLASDESMLSSLFALLVYAHYRTQPSDLLHLLDDPGVRIYTLQQGDKMIAALLVNQEGGFDEKLASEIYRGERRPSGHLLAQTLTFHAGCQPAATLNYARIMRIAVHPQLQGSGYGSCLLNQVVQREQQQGVDAIGTSFGATPELLRFWQHAGFALVRMGFTRDHASGTHSAVMLKPFSPAGQRVFEESRQRFLRSLPDWLVEPLHDLPEEMRNALKNLQQPVSRELSKADWQDIESFIETHRGYETCMGALRRLLEPNQGELGILTEPERSVVEARILQRQGWAETVKNSGVSGKAAAIRLLRTAIGKIVEKIN
ncbi:MAG: GNAT family N-acetyltransferase [Thioalkalispiraceae bacterium]|jgi:tRNA(Met) cytidine acetyltransferase